MRERLLSGLLMIKILVVTSLCFSIAFARSTMVFADSINDGVFAIDSKPYGMTYEQWTIKFWQWVMPVPTDRNPVSDTTGEFCNENQGDLPVFFLAFRGGGVTERTCDVPAGKAILVPVNIVEYSFLELASAKTEQELHVATEEDESSNPGAYLSVDGRELKDVLTYRVHSQAFDVTFAKPDIFGTSGGPTRAVSDGYWIILEPLSPGAHELHFKAILTNPKTGVLIYSDDITYHLNVAENRVFSSTLQGASTSGNFNVQVNWTSADIGNENTFSITIMTANGQVLSGATYDVMLFKGEKRLDESYRTEQTVTSQKYTFDEQGSYTLRIENINGSGQSDAITLPIQVTPEYPASIFIFTAALAGIMIPIRFRRVFAGR